MNKSFKYQSISELSKLLKNKTISPVELTSYFLDKLETQGSDYNAIAHINRSSAINQAKKAESQIMKDQYIGSLHGIPFAAKDLLSTNDGSPTSWGAKPFINNIYNIESTVISNLKNSGAILCAKTSMVEFAGGMGYQQPDASAFGPGINPWNKAYWSGGSSSGSGSAVSAGLIPFAIGSETWGSILSPAANCGVTGLRPTFGIVSRYGSMVLSWTLDKIGPLALSAKDSNIIIKHMIGKDEKDEYSINNKFNSNIKIPSNIKIGIPKNINKNMQDEVKKNFESTLKILQSKYQVIEIDLPEIPISAATRTILLAEVSAAFENVFDEKIQSQLNAKETHYSVLATNTVLAKDYIKSLRIQNVTNKKMNDLFTDIDVIISPVKPTTASKIDENFRWATRKDFNEEHPTTSIGAIGNLIGLPAISIPNGFDKKGLLTSFQIMSNKHKHDLIIKLAEFIQDNSDWHNKHPN